MSKPKKTIQEIVQKAHPDFTGEVDRLGLQELEKRLNTLAKGAEENEEAKENDEDLERAQAEATEMAAPYREYKKANRLKTRYVISLIKERGGEA